VVADAESAARAAGAALARMACGGWRGAAPVTWANARRAHAPAQPRLPARRWPDIALTKPPDHRFCPAANPRRAALLRPVRSCRTDRPLRPAQNRRERTDSHGRMDCHQDW
jgi:hypothetical protein